ncbi:MAG: 3-oxoacyl-ACP synthase, partial [Desulfobacterales bacterium]
EAQATGSIYGKGPLVTGLKSYMGHTMGSCGAIEGIITLYMMAEGFVPPTLNLVEVDGRCAMIRHVQHIEKKEIQIAAVQNFAFGGVNTCFILKNISGR